MSKEDTCYLPGLTIISTPSNLSSANHLEVLKLINTLTNVGFGDVDKLLSSLPYHISYDTVIDGIKNAENTDLTISATSELMKVVATKLEEYGMKIHHEEPTNPGSSSAIPKLISKLINNGKNILLYGPKGVGKTAMTEQACILSGHMVPTTIVPDLVFDNEGNEVPNLEGIVIENPHPRAGKVDTDKVKYFSMATLHPEDFVGIPAPDTRPGQEAFFKYLMLHGLFDCEVLILDEFNRAHPKVLNGVMQILHARSINDMELPRLRSVVAMINPPDEGDYHGTDDLDEAIVDRFDHFLEIKASPSAEYLAKVLGGTADCARVAEHLVEWWATDLAKDARSKISPRRLEKMGRAYLDNEGLKTVLFKKVTPVNLNLLEKRLAGLDIITSASFVKDPKKIMDLMRTNTPEGKDAMFRMREILNQLHSSRDHKNMATCAQSLKVMDRDMIKAIDRNPDLKKFMFEAIERYATDAEKEDILDAFAERASGAEALRERREAVAKELNTRIDEKKIKI